jgi:hypothetical protein
MSKLTRTLSMPAAALALSAAIAGCGMMNDNPVAADKMNEIRAKEARGRQNTSADASAPGTPPNAKQ